MVGVAEVAVEAVVRGIGHESQVGIVQLVEQVGMLHVDFHTAVVDQGAVGDSNVFDQLAPLAVLIEEIDTGMHDVASALVFPAVGEVDLPQGRGVVPKVAVGIVVGKVLLVVGKEFGAEVGVEVDVAHEVTLGLEAAVAIEVQRQAGFFVGLYIFDVDLAGDALVALFDAGGAFADLYAFHPGTRHIAQ